MAFDGTKTQSAMEVEVEDNTEFEEYCENDLDLHINSNSTPTVLMSYDWKLDQNTQCRVTLEKLKIWSSRTDFHKDLEEENCDNRNDGNIDTSETSIHLKFKLLVQEMCELLSKCEEKCGVCEEYVQKLQEHVIQTHEAQTNHGHKNSLPEFKCDISNKNFSTSLEFKRHRETHSLGNFGKVSASTSFEIADYPTTTVVEHSVHTNQVLRPECLKKIYIQENSTMDKTNERQNLVAEEENRLSHSGTQDTNTNRKRYHECFECKKIFTTPGILARHLRTHIDEKPNFICTKQFSRVGCHSKTLLAVKTHQCPHCDKSLTNRQGLENHMMTHTGERPYECQVCHKRFALLSTLKNHSLTHTGEKPFKCSRCEKAFSQIGARISHEKLHTGERTYQCQLCVKTYIQKTKLEIHMRNHSGERPYKCQTCSKGFTSPWGLKSHMKTHTGEKTFCCKNTGE